MKRWSRFLGLIGWGLGTVSNGIVWVAWLLGYIEWWGLVFAAINEAVLIWVCSEVALRPQPSGRKIVEGLEPMIRKARLEEMRYGVSNPDYGGVYWRDIEKVLEEA